MRRIGSTENVMKRGSRFLSFGVISSLFLVTGCGSSPISPTQVSSIPTVYVTQYNSTTQTSSVLEFPANSQGSVAPANTLTLPTGNVASYLAVDSSGNIYVAMGLPFTEIVVYPASATGGGAPTRTITNLPPTFSGGIAVDHAGQLYLSTPGTISIFASNATGNAVPIRQIMNANIGGTVAVDSQGNIYTSTYDLSASSATVSVFSPTASGNATPTREISGALTGLGVLTCLSVDPGGDLFVGSFVPLSLGPSSVLEFAPGATGNVAPLQTLTSVANESPFGLTVDTTGNVYVAVTHTATTPQPSVQVFSSSKLSGNVSPTATFTSTAWTGPSGGLAIH
jgi:hypothetical protein